MDQFAESLDAGNHAGFCVAAAEHLPIDLHSGLPGGASQFAKQTAVVAAVDPQSFGDGEDELPVCRWGTGAQIVSAIVSAANRVRF
jgi:hypothetical protein